MEIKLPLKLLIKCFLTCSVTKEATAVRRPLATTRESPWASMKTQCSHKQINRNKHLTILMDGLNSKLDTIKERIVN